jgi:hypothetical protein
MNSINSSRVGKDKAEALLELQKFFQRAINEYARGRFATVDQLEELQKVVLKLASAVTALTQENAYLKQENVILRKASKLKGSAASYGMLSRKEEKKLDQIH